MRILLERLESFGSSRIALMGDFMLDRWVYGSADRLSQEAPVPVLLETRRSTLTGGAGNVAEAIVALGGQAACIGAVGDDEGGRELLCLLNEAGAETADMVKLDGRPTTGQDTLRRTGPASPRPAALPGRRGSVRTR